MLSKYFRRLEEYEVEIIRLVMSSLNLLYREKYGGMMVLLLCSLFVWSIPASSQKVVTVAGEYTYYAPEDESPKEAKEKALQLAQLNALANEFGTIVSQTNLTKIENSNGRSSNHFLSLNSSDVRGEWLETIGKPEITVRYEENMLIVTCKIRGKAREVLAAHIEVIGKTLRNGTDDNCESDHFKSNDQLYLSFQSPVRGYLAAYLVDDDGEVACLLPYQEQQDGVCRIEANKRYVFFKRGQSQFDTTDELVITCKRAIEHNQLYFIFSPNGFVKAVDKESEKETGNGIGGYPRELSYEDFHNWLAKCRRHDKNMTLIKKVLTIEK